MSYHYSPQRSQSDENVTSRINLPITNSTQNRNSIWFKNNTIMWNPSFFFISNRFHRSQNNVGPLNVTKNCWSLKLSLWSPAMPSTEHHRVVTCPVTVATVKTIVIADSFWMQFCVSRDLFPTSPQGKLRNELSHREHKVVLTET